MCPTHIQHWDYNKNGLNVRTTKFENDANRPTKTIGMVLANNKGLGSATLQILKIS